MRHSIVTTFSGFHTVVEQHPADMYRGVSDIGFKLLPKIARDWHLKHLGLLRYVEKYMLEMFKIHSARYLGFRPNSTLEWLAMGQHHGLPTRLLDWTKNPLVALYFACRENQNKDAAVYFSQGLSVIDLSQDINPFEIDDDKQWIPAHFTDRLANQNGLFSISKNPMEPLRKGIFHKVIVKAEAKGYIISTLRTYGIHPGSLFPGLDGISKYVEDEHFLLRGVTDLAKLKVLLKEKIESFASEPG